MKTLEVYTNDGRTFTTTVEVYSASELAEQLSSANGGNSFIAIGDIVLQKHSIQRIVPVTETATETTEEV